MDDSKCREFRRKEDSSGCDDDAARCKDPRMQSYGCI